jgi:NADH:ubiquinone oxidoreductase subunit F (NADH-binding)
VRTSARLLAAPSPDLAAHLDIWGSLPTLSARQLVAEIEAAGLLGKGGAGFPTARKMRAVTASGKTAVVVGNGAESEPASAKDRLLLSRSPHLVLDGLQLAARAVGADSAHLALHADPSLAQRVRSALSERRDPIPVQVAKCPSPYVASEESSLVHWLNGGDARPTFTPPRPYQSGVGKRPTLINNVETLAHLAAIAHNGADWFTSIGDADEPGTTLVTVSGDGVGRRVAEVSTGTTIGGILTAAGVPATRTQAVLVGGYFGTWLPRQVATHAPLTHAGLRSVGGALGAGVIVALPTDRCGLAETARVATYLAAHSARQCGPCLNGLPAIAAAVRNLATGSWDESHWPSLERWLAIVPGRGACRHPDGAVRFVTSALRVFADDVAEHRAGRPCANLGAAGWLPVPTLTRPEWR